MKISEYDQFPDIFTPDVAELIYMSSLDRLSCYEKFKISYEEADGILRQYRAKYYLLKPNSFRFPEKVLYRVEDGKFISCRWGMKVNTFSTRGRQMNEYSPVWINDCLTNLPRFIHRDKKAKSIQQKKLGLDERVEEIYTVPIIYFDSTSKMRTKIKISTINFPISR